MVPSAAIRDFSYDESRNELTVTFTNGRAYVYSMVPPPVATALGAAASPGAFFNDTIRDRYPFRRRAPGGVGSLRDALSASRES